MPRGAIALGKSTPKIGGRLQIAATVALHVYDVVAAPSGSRRPPRRCQHGGRPRGRGLRFSGFGADLGTVGPAVGGILGGVVGGVVGIGIGVVDGIEDLS